MIIKMLVAKLKHITGKVINYLKDRNLRYFYYLIHTYGNSARFERQVINWDGYQFCVPDAQSFIWQYKEIFVDEIYKFQAKVYNPVIIDVGSNIGTSIIYFKQQYPNSHILGFEADPTVFNYLKDNINTFKYNFVELIDAAAWVNDDGITFGVEGADGGSICSNEHSILVKSVRLLDYINKYDKIDMLKIDIEGAEVEVLTDCQSVIHKIEHLFIEYHSWTDKPQELSSILSILERNKFRYYMYTINQVNYPFIARSKGLMDLQINIFAINESDI